MKLGNINDSIKLLCAENDVMGVQNWVPADGVLLGAGGQTRHRLEKPYLMSKYNTVESVYGVAGAHAVDRANEMTG